MEVRKLLTGITAAVALLATTAAPSMADSQTFASATSIFSVFSYSSSNSGKVIVTPANTTHFTSTALPGFNDINDTLSFTGLQNVGDALVSAGVFYNQGLTGGTFSLKHGATTLLSGTFTQGVLGAIIGFGNKDANISFLGVAYTGGTYWTAAQGLGFLNPGDLSLALLSNTPLASVNVPGGVRIASFNASGTGTFGATQLLPEPGSVMPFVIGVLGLGVLAFRGRKNLQLRNTVA